MDLKSFQTNIFTTVLASIRITAGGLFLLLLPPVSRQWLWRLRSRGETPQVEKECRATWHWFSLGVCASPAWLGQLNLRQLTSVPSYPVPGHPKINIPSLTSRILFATSESLAPAYALRVKVIHGHGCQEMKIFGNILESVCLPPRKVNQFCD